MSARRSLALAAVAALVTSLAGVGGAGPAEASGGRLARAGDAGTLVYIKANNVWLADGDGTGARALTTDGTSTRPYASPSQSDQGIIAVGHLDEIVRMDQSGRVLNTMNPAPLPSSVSGHPIDGNLQDVAISPDGSLIAYSMATFLNPPGASAGYRYATGYTTATSLSASGPRGTTFFDAPSWVGNSRTLQSGGYGSHMMIDDLGPSEPVHWFDDSDIYVDSTDLGNAELSPNGRYLAAVRGYDADSYVYWYRVNGNATTGAAPADPTPLCNIGPASVMTDPTWAPDSDSLAWTEADGIWVRSGAEDCSVLSELLIPGGSQPDWSRAPLAPPVHHDDDPRPRAIKSLKRPGIAGQARVGRVLTASPGRWSPGSVKTRFAWKRNGKAVRGADGRRYKMTRKDRGKRIAVTVTASRSGWRATTVSSKPVRVR